MDNNNYDNQIDSQNNYQEPQYYQQPEPVWNNDDADSSSEGKGQAIAALVTGICSVLCYGCMPAGVAAIILAIVAKNKGNNSGMATAGLVLGIIGLVLWAGGFVYTLMHPEALNEYMELFE
ncbi:MAG: DUF4190 domain-containing protein [Clostridiales bacterium]|nr:DUF4190 domain-containing protein [Clostridiales bacterium]